MLIYAHKAVAAPEAALIGSCRSVCAEEGRLAPGASVKVGHGCLSMFYMLWIHWLHTSVALPLHRTSPSKQARLASKKLSTHQELSSASFNSSMSGSSQGIIIKSMPQLHLAWLCECVCVCMRAGGAAFWACLC